MAEKIIIDTDPGIDDAMAIHLAFADPAVEVLGLTSIFGNVFVEQATRNALLLTEQASYDCFVAEGCQVPQIQPQNPPSLRQKKTHVQHILPSQKHAARIRARWCCALSGRSPILPRCWIMIPRSQNL